jgi:hypothetical protein
MNLPLREIFFCHSFAKLAVSGFSGKEAKSGFSRFTNQGEKYRKQWHECLKIGETMGRIPQEAAGPCLDRRRIVKVTFQTFPLKGVAASASSSYGVLLRGINKRLFSTFFSCRSKFPAIISRLRRKSIFLNQWQ